MQYSERQFQKAERSTAPKSPPRCATNELANWKFSRWMTTFTFYEYLSLLMPFPSQSGIFPPRKLSAIMDRHVSLRDASRRPKLLPP